MGASANDALLLLTGQGGENLIVNDTTARTGNWRRLSVLANAGSVSITLDGVESTGLSLTAGVDIYGKITALTLGSGTVILYK